MGSLDDAVRLLRTETFSKHWPLDEEIREISAPVASHGFLANPSGQYLYVYLTRFVKALSEKHFGCSFGNLTVLDWGCGKGHVSKLIRDLGPKHLDSCDILSDRGDSAFGQEIPIIKRFDIQVKPLQHEYVLPYESASFDAVLSVGVLEHVSNERASLAEIFRVLKPQGAVLLFLSSYQTLMDAAGLSLAGRRLSRQTLYRGSRERDAQRRGTGPPGCVVPAASTQEFASISKIPALQKNGSTRDGIHPASLLRDKHRVRKRQAHTDALKKSLDSTKFFSFVLGKLALEEAAAKPHNNEEDLDRHFQTV
jgi:SAM-dependent methyltransferase